VIRDNPAFLSKNAETDDRAECRRSDCVRARLVRSRADISPGSTRPSLLTGESGLEGDRGPYTSVVRTECAVVMMEGIQKSVWHYQPEDGSAELSYIIIH
jgi:hypothetical protein